MNSRLAAAFIMGMGVSREVTGGFSLTPDQCERMATRMDQMLEAIIDG